MATERALLLQSWYEAAQKDVLSAADGHDAGDTEPPAAVIVSYLTDSRKRLKVTQQQLCMLDLMLQFLENVQPTDLLDGSPDSDTDADARVRLAALKSAYAEGVERAEGLIAALLDRLEQAGRKKEELEHLLCVLGKKKEELEEKQKMKEKEDLKEERLNSLKLQKLEDSLLNSQRALQASERRIAELMAQTDAHLDSLDSWTLLWDGRQQSLEATLGPTGYKLLWLGPQELSLELIPQVHRPDLTSLKPLSLSLTWTSDGFFNIQSQDAAGSLDVASQGPLSQVSVSLQEITQQYLSQGEMLAEIQDIHSRFAIDWRPDQRLLVFLKSASVVCHLCVAEGYPSRGCVSLVSVRGEKGPVNIDSVEPPQANPSLTDWLEFLTYCPDF
ncbi:hypothetical protein GJAV_G00223990 [Gymnothorax javanicus]|nr:hypothetical protein GJAV_G00223990 [Gymnothorax javanicus]